MACFVRDYLVNLIFIIIYMNEKITSMWLAESRPICHLMLNLHCRVNYGTHIFIFLSHNKWVILQNLVQFVIYTTVKALVSDYLGNSKQWVVTRAGRL